MNNIPCCPVCKQELELNVLENTIFSFKDMYCCFGSITHAFSFFEKENKFGLVVSSDGDQLSANIDGVYINNVKYEVSNNYNVNNCYEILMEHYSRFCNLKVFS